MDFEQVITKRRSIRGYSNKSISENIIEKLKYALSVAPSGNNRQPYKFIFIKDNNIRKSIAQKACHQEFISQAALICVACCEEGHSFDTAIAIDHMVLEAVNCGLGACWIGWFEKEAVRTLLNIPADMEIPIIVTLGYYENEPEPKERKALSEIISVDGYQ
jgi:nitroreductase